MKIDSWRDLEVYRNAFALQQAIFEVSKGWPGACYVSEPIQLSVVSNRGCGSDAQDANEPIPNAQAGNGRARRPRRARRMKNRGARRMNLAKHPPIRLSVVSSRGNGSDARNASEAVSKAEARSEAHTTPDETLRH